MSQKVLFVTNLGSFEVELYVKHCPLTCKNFYELSRRNVFSKTKFHRIVPGFIVQGGDPTGTGFGGENIYGKKFFQDEITPYLKHTGAGILGSANLGKPNTNSSQFYITLAPAPRMDGKNTIFGRVSKGLETIQRMSRIRVNKQNQPIQDITVLKVECL